MSFSPKISSVKVISIKSKTFKLYKNKNKKEYFEYFSLMCLLNNILKGNNFISYNFSVSRSILKQVKPVLGSNDGGKTSGDYL